eukprot:RCo021812
MNQWPSSATYTSAIGILGEEDECPLHFDTDRLLEVDTDPRRPQQRLSWTFPTNYEVSFIAQPDPPQEEDGEVVRSRARTLPVAQNRSPDESHYNLEARPLRSAEDFVLRYLREQKKEKLAKLLEAGASSNSSPTCTLPVPEQHELEHEWTFWFDSVYRPSDVPFSEALEELGSFSTIEGFWSFWNHLNVGQLKDNCNLRMFRRGTKPLWEDPMNRKGGRWVAKNLPCAERRRLWSYTVMAVIGENLEDDTLRESVCGVVLSTRKEGDTIQLWTDGGYQYRERCRQKEETPQPVPGGDPRMITQLQSILFPPPSPSTPSTAAPAGSSSSSSSSSSSTAATTASSSSGS